MIPSDKIPFEYILSQIFFIFELYIPMCSGLKILYSSSSYLYLKFDLFISSYIITFCKPILPNKFLILTSLIIFRISSSFNSSSFSSNSSNSSNSSHTSNYSNSSLTQIESIELVDFQPAKINSQNISNDLIINILPDTNINKLPDTKNLPCSEITHIIPIIQKKSNNIELEDDFVVVYTEFEDDDETSSLLHDNIIIQNKYKLI